MVTEFPDHAAEAADHHDPLYKIFHHHIENGGRQPVLRMIYGENTKARELIDDGSSNLNKRSHSWAMRKPIETTKNTIIDSGDGVKSPLFLERKNYLEGINKKNNMD